MKAATTLTVHAGRDREGDPETFGELVFRPGDLVAVVGPTGCGKSRLLADIEWLSEGDSPSGRVVRMISPEEEDLDPLSDHAHRRVAQLSQSMQFSLDLDVGPFLILHAKARDLPDPEVAAREVIDAACTLCGEAFLATTHLSALSGGQSRSLMIADTALIAAAPIVLVDEVENAGVDRRKALDLLVSRDKIVLMATHDPLLALLAPRRLVLARGGVRQVRERSAGEAGLLAELEARDARQSRLRERLRDGLSACEDES